VTRVRVLFLGGTIAMTKGEPTGGELLPELTGSEVLVGVPVPADLVVESLDVAQVDSSALTFDTCLRVLDLADEAVRGGADGVVVVQGTDSLEETSFLWDLLWTHDGPLVVTGAMRSPDQPGADGPANLVAAIGAATSPQCRGQGVLVVVGDEIHAARFVAKRHAGSPAAFGSPELGPVGRVFEGAPVLLARVDRRTPLPRPRPRDRPGERHWPRVGLVTAGLDDDPSAYLALAGVSDGLVVEGFGAGQLRPEVAEALDDVVTRIPVLLASRAGAGAVATRTYGGPGSGSDLHRRGLVPTGHLGALKARVLLRLVLAGLPDVRDGTAPDPATTRQVVDTAFAPYRP
jgi:L-asparaginase